MNFLVRHHDINFQACKIKSLHYHTYAKLLKLSEMVCPPEGQFT